MYPVVPVKMPMSLTKAKNGELPVTLLTAVPFVGVGHGSLHPLAARAWYALTVACMADMKVQLTVTSTADAYRSLGQQETVFFQRYRKVYNPITCTLSDPRTYQGRRWFKLKNVAPVASPGTSNHGWALACDVACWFKGPHPSALASNPAVLNWLLAPAPPAYGNVCNAVSLGWSWESQKESWHLRYVAGDAVPARVLDIEKFLAHLKP